MIQSIVRPRRPTSVWDSMEEETDRVGLDQVSGTIPASLSSMTDMWKLDLSVNRLVGTLPPSLGAMTGVKYFRMDQNELNGTVPEEYAGLLGIQNIELESNSLTGEVGPGVCALVNQQQQVNSRTTVIADCLTGDIVCPCCTKCV